MALGDGKMKGHVESQMTDFRREKTAANVLESNKAKRPILASNVPDRFVLNAVEKYAQIMQ